jgi:antitoxin FitA
MTTITVPISEEGLERLNEIARIAGLPPEELARAGLEDWLREPRQDFLDAARHVLQKNEELYRRLA